MGSYINWKVKILWILSGYSYLSLFIGGAHNHLLYSSAMDVSLASLLPVVYDRNTMRTIKKTALLWVYFLYQISKYLAHMYLLTFRQKCVLFGIMLSDGYFEKGVNLVRFSFIQAILAHAEYLWFVFFLYAIL